jgi:hypothetical protein
VPPVQPLWTFCEDPASMRSGPLISRGFSGRRFPALCALFLQSPSATNHSAKSAMASPGWLN